MAEIWSLLAWDSYKSVGFWMVKLKSIKIRKLDNEMVFFKNVFFP